MKIIILLSACILSIYFIYLRFINTLKLRTLFKKLSIVLCGKRGKGKDVIFSYIAKGKKHNSNIILQPNTNVIKLNDLIIPNLSREKLINDTFSKIDRENYKKFDNMTLISDAGIYFPNWDENNLKKEYKELPITWAIWRHLFNNGCHFNIQKCGRLWKLLREQIEDVIEIENINKGIFYFKLKLIHYERLEDAELGLKPLKKPILKTKKDNNLSIENSKRGKIEEFNVLIPKRYIKHDTKYFRKVVFNEEENC